MNKRTYLLVCVALGLAACGGKQANPGVDAVFLNANVYTVNEAQPTAEAIAIDGGAIVYVGDNAGAEALMGEQTTRHDLNGQLLMPGFIDTHVHPLGGGAYAKALALDTFGTVDDWVAAIEAYAKANPDQETLFGYGFLASTFGPVGPTRQLIDDIVPDRPVLLMDEGFHGAWANTAALKALNITQDTADPVPGYSYYKRDENGDATGYLLEGTAGMAMDALDVINDEVIAEGTGIVVDIMNSYGVTAAFDAGGRGEPEWTKAMLDRLNASGDLTLRLTGSVRATTKNTPQETVERAARWKDVVKGDNYRYDTLKIPDDGTVEGRTAAMFEDYQGEPGNSGETVFTEQQLIEMISGVASKNIDVHIHALGERAIHETLNAIEAARESFPDTDSRFTICHLQVIIDQDVPRFGELDVIAQSTPLWASYDNYGEQFVSADQFQRYWRYKGLEEGGAKLTFGSDFPASGAGTLGLSPVVQIEIGHTRQNAGDPDARVQPAESERISVESLVKGFTIDAAYQLRMEDEIGSIEVGKRADLVVLDQDIFSVDPYSIHKTKVMMTLLDGNVIYADAT
ncbi:MAG: amidohydrolase [Woeseiaceae bacterium]